jgi:hypothetical protein
MNCKGVVALLIALFALVSSDIDRDKFNPNIFGTSTIVKNITVYGALISSTGISTNLELTNTRKDVDHTSSSTSSTSSRISASEMAELRANHSRNIQKQLPFPVVEWPSIFTRPCPSSKHTHKTERGVALAHYQIWLDFIYFDYKDIDTKSSMNSRSKEKVSFSKDDKGNLYKNGIPFKDDDIIVIFEDDADIAIKNANETIIEELQQMSTDILYLGWCNGRAARPVPLCAHAYALTRKGARQAVKHYEPCGLAVDEQFVIMGKNKWLTFRTVNPWSYKNNLNENYPRAYDQTHGIFHQLRIGSFNGH